MAKERLTDSDLAMMNNANGVMQQAQAVHQFATQHLTATYNLGPRDQIRSDGEIVRHKQEDG